MVRTRFTANTLKDIVNTVLSDEDVNALVQDGKEEWIGKTEMDVLNVHYYTFKHKVANNTEKIAIMKSQDDTLQEDTLDVTKQSYCLVTINSQQRQFSKNIDQISVEGNLEYWLQSEKVHLLEDLIESANLATCGLRIPLEINGQSKNVIIYFDSFTASNLDQDKLGETMIVNVGVSLLIKPQYSSCSDYKFEFLIGENYVELPVTRFNYDISMVQKTLPNMNRPSSTDSLNLSCVTCFSLSYNLDKDNQVAKMFRTDSIKKAATNALEVPKNNKSYVMKWTIDDEENYVYNLILKSFSGQVDNSIEDEGNTIVLVCGGEYGS